MFEFEFLQAIDDYIKTFRNFELPVVLCNTKFQVYWANLVAREHSPKLIATESLAELLGEYDLDTLSAMVYNEDGKTIAGMIPFNNIRVNLTPILNQGNYVGVLLILTQPENLPSIEKLENISTASSVFANDVRDTISGIFSSMDAIALKADLLKADWVKPHLSSIAFDSYRVLRISNNVLKFTKYRNFETDLDLTSYNIMDWLDRISHSVSVMGRDMGIPVHFDIEDTDRYVLLDSKKFEAAFFNVIHNALYYTRVGNKVTITARAKEEYLRITVEDKGVGIPKDALPRVFEPYFSLMPPGFPPNLGLGLTIAHMVFVSHKGEITVESTEGEGTKVTIFLPYPDISARLNFRQGDHNYSLQDRFSPMYVGLTSAKHSPFSTL